jgi:hypothetical protein
MSVRLTLRAVLAAVWVLLGGCNRTFDVPEGTLQLGQRCGAAGECRSASCADGVCCDTRCGVQVCNLAGSVGTCTDRPRGHGCDAGAECPGGFCRDGVCCDSDCSDSCHTCAAPGAAGTCTPAPDNTDAHGDCGRCAACFSGVCGTAFDGTDPHGECDAGQTCGYGDCYAAPGTACTLEAGCAVGSCVAYECMETAYARIDDYPFLRTDLHRAPLAMASGPGGGTAVLVDTDDGTYEDGGYLGRVAAAVAPTPLGPWTAANIEYTAPRRRKGAAAITGDVAFFAVESTFAPGSDDAVYNGYSGIYGQEVRATGLLGAFSDPDPDSVDPVQIAAAADALGRLTLATVADGGALRVAVRGVDGRWGPTAVRASGATGVAACRADGETQLLYTAGGHLAVLLGDGSVETAPSPSGCAGPLYAVAAPDADGDEVGLVVRCDGLDQLGVFKPRGAGAARWRFVPAPTTAPFFGTANAGEGSVDYPISLIRPAGGRHGIILFNSLEPGGAPGAPRGGFVQLLWLERDGGVTFALATEPDNGYRYVDLATASSPTGAPLAAYDSVVDIDGGVPVNNATLLIESYYP